MTKVKVVHVTQSLGGVKTYIEHIFNYSNPEQFEFVVIAPEHSEFQEFCLERSIKYYPLKMTRSINPFRDLMVMFSLISIFKKEKPEVIHTHSAKGGYLGRLAARFVDAKVIYAPHAFSYLSFKGLKRTVFYQLESIARKWTDILLSVSHSEANRAIYEVGYDDSNVNTIMNAIPVSNLLPFRNYNKCSKVGMIGRLTYQKNPLLFLKIADQIVTKYPNIEFSILGAGLTDHLTKEINDFIKEHNLGDKVHILPWGDNNTSKKFLEDVDIFLLTSVFEGLPFSLVEAMASGIPCVVSKVDGNSDVIQNYENGFSCITADEFVQKVELLVESADLRRKLGQAGNRYVKEWHDIKINITELEDLYNNLSGRKAPVRKQEVFNFIPEEGTNLKVIPGI